MKNFDSPEIKTRIEKLKLLILDVDGILTDSRLFWIEGQGWTRMFSVRDGYGIRLLLKNGFDVAVISAGASDDVKKRMEFLGIPHTYFGNEDKLSAYEDLLKKLKLRDEQVAYLADDLFDLPILERVGFSASVPDAVEAVRKRVHYVTQVHGGFGAAREVIDGIRKVQRIGAYLD